MTCPAARPALLAALRCHRFGQVAAQLAVLVVVPLGLVFCIAGRGWAAGPADQVDCGDPLLTETHIRSTIEVRTDEVDLPLVTITDTYEVPTAWSGTDALLGERNTSQHDRALRCLMVGWEDNDYRPKEPVISLVSASGSGTKAQSTVEVQDQLLVELYNGQRSYAGSWMLDWSSGDLRISIINLDASDRSSVLPRQFYGFDRSVSIELSGARLSSMNPRPASFDGQTHAAWELVEGNELRAWSAVATLGTSKRITTATGSGVGRIASEISKRLAEAAFYISLLLVIWQRGVKRVSHAATAVPRQLRPILLMAGLSLAGLAAGLSPYLVTRDFVELTGEAWRWGALVSLLLIASVLAVLSVWSRRLLNMLVLIPLLGLGSALIFWPEWFRFTQDMDFIPAGSRTGPVRGSDFASATWLLGFLILLTWALLLAVGVALQGIMQVRENSRDSEVHPQSAKLRTSGPAVLVFTGLIAAFIVLGWIWQQKHTWDHYNLFPAFDPDRTRASIQYLADSMIVYPLALLEEFNGVFWYLAVIAVIFVLNSKEVKALRPNRSQYLLISVTLPYTIYYSGWYLGFWIPLSLLLGILIFAVALPRIGWRSLLVSPVVRPRGAGIGEQRNLPLETVIADSGSLRPALVEAQAMLQIARLAARTLEDDLVAGKISVQQHDVKLREIEEAIEDYQSLPPRPSRQGAGRRLGWHRFLRPRHVRSDTEWVLRDDVAPGDVAISLGPGDSWTMNGVLAARFMLGVSLPAMVYFVWLATRPGQWADPLEYFGSLHVVEAVASEVFFWASTGFFFGCLWTTLPGRRGAIKGLVFSIAVSIPLATDQFLAVLLGQSRDSFAVPRMLAMTVLFVLIGVIFDWEIMHTEDQQGLRSWRPLLSMYGMRKPLSAAAVLIPIIASVVGIYFQLRAGLWGTDTPIQPADRGRP